MCGDCGTFFGSKVWHSNDKYRKVIWRCNHKFDGDQKCDTPALDEEEIKARFLTAINSMMIHKESILDDCRLMQAALTDCTEIDTELENLLQEIEVVSELTRRRIEENSNSAQNQEEYAIRYNGLIDRYEAAKARVEKLQAERAERLAKADAIGAFMFELMGREYMFTEFDDRLWLASVDIVTVYSDGRLVFRFQNGTEIEV